MDILVAFVMGTFSGTLVMAFMAGATLVRKENEAYMEGFLAGKRDKNGE